MAQWLWALVAVIGIVIVIAIALVINRQRRTISLQQRFGPEYDRVVDRADDRRSAEAALAERARRRSALDVVPLAEPVRLRYADQWRGVQELFVDRPSEAVDSAEDLLARVMKDRGYPMGEFDQQAELISVDHPHVVENYRIAHEIHGRNREHQATTEDLREAMLRYRSLFDDLLNPEQRSADRSDHDRADHDRSDHDRADHDRADHDRADRDRVDRRRTDQEADAQDADLTDRRVTELRRRENR